MVVNMVDSIKPPLAKKIDVSKGARRSGESISVSCSRALALLI